MAAGTSADRADRELLLSLYRTMLTIRAFENTAGSLFAAGKLPGFIHLSIGQEGVAAGVCSVLASHDQISTTHRGHGHCIAKGADLDGMMAELFGRSTGYSKGRSGSMHIADPSVGILGANAIVGGGIPMAVGAAYSSVLHAQATGQLRVAVAFFGEGAVAEGVFHECLNLAALWRLPIVFVCENNGYAELTPVSVHLAATNVADLAGPYRIPAERVDGNDVLAVRSGAQRAVGRARAGEGPTLLECATYRWRGHFEGDPQRYRTTEESSAWRERDPISGLRRHLCEEVGIAGIDLDDIDREINVRVDLAAERAEAADLTPISWIYDDIYASPEGASSCRK